MSRTRASARAAGAKAERDAADWLATALDDDRIDRRVKRGNKDRGDIGGVRVHGQRLVIEVKDEVTLKLSGWVNEAHIEAGNDDALAGVVLHKRRGKANPADWYVTCTGADLIALITGQRPGDPA